MLTNYLRKYFVLLLFVAAGIVCSFGATIDLTRTEFFVKENGTGSGTDWTDAMSAIDFAATLPKAKEGTTFYVAAGTYKPIYTFEGDVAKSNMEKSFGIKSSVTIKGGYSKNANSPDAICNPRRHLTLFTADIDGDDIIELSENSISRTNFENNANNLFHLHAENKTLTLSGITVSNANTCGLLSVSNGNKLILSDCIFKDNTCGIRSIDDSSIDITNSTFLQNEYPIDCGNAGSDENDCKVDIKQTVFSSNQSDLRFRCGPLVFDEIEYTYNKGQILLECDGDLLIKNSTFEHNISSGDLLLFHDNPGKYDILIENCSFKQNDVHNLLYHDAQNMNLKIKNCIVSNNTVYDVLGTQSKSDEIKIVIESSSFTNNTASHIFESVFGTTLVNNTIAENNIDKSIISAYDVLTMENNTILDRSGNDILEAYSTLEARGNIILPSNSSGRAIRLTQNGFVLENNIITDASYHSLRPIPDADYEGNIHLTDEKSINEALAALFEGKITSTGFEPKISLNKDNFPTLNLVSDVLSDGVTSIRYPLATTSQTTDQFGATRSSLTCMGSLELCADDIDVEWTPETYNICDNSSLGEYEIHYTFKDNSPSSLFYGVVKNEKGETFKSSIGSNRVKSGYIVFRDLPVGEYSNMRFFVESGTCREIKFHDGEAQIPNSFKILSTESMATLDLRTTSDSKCAAEGSGLFSVYCSKSVTTFQVFDDEGEKVDEFVVDSCPLSTSLIIKDEVKSVQNLKAGKYHVRYAGCPENISDFEIEVGAPFSATAKLLETCMSSPGRVVMEVYDANGKPASGDFSFHNPEYPENALEELDGNPNNSDPKDNVRMFSEGKYLIQNAGRPADVILVSDGTCEIKVPTEKYTATEEDLKIKIDGAISKFCAGDETGSIEFSYNGFKGGDYYDVALRLDDGALDFLYGQKKSFVYENLAPGEHRIMASISTGYMGCNISDGYIYDKIITLEPPTAIKVTPKVAASSCGKSNGGVEIVITGWDVNENSWKFYKKEDAATSAEIPFSKTVTSNTDGTVSVKKASLAGGVYVFEWKESCGKTNTESITIPSGANKPISVTDIIEGYSCKEKADGKITYVVTNWTSECSATLDKTDKTPTTISDDGVAEFVFSGLSNDYYEFSVIDGCGDSYPLTSNLKGAGTALTMQRFTVKPNSNRCVIKDRVIQIAVSGGKTSSYKLDLKDASGKSVEKKTIKGSYTTSPLPNGMYNAVISNSDESCTVTSSSVTLSSKFTVGLTSYDYTSCPNSTSNLRLVAEVKRVGTNTVGSDLSFVAVDGEGVETEIPSINIRPLGNGKYVLIHVPATTDYIVTSDGDCAYISYIKDAAIGKVSTADMSAEISSKNQTCYETNNAEISAVFSKMNALYDINFTLAPEEGESSTKTSYAESGTLTYDKLSAGIYSADVWVAIENCNLTSLTQKAVTIESPESDLKITVVSTAPSKCGDDGAVSLKLTNFYKDATYQYAFHKKGTASPDYSKLTPASDNTFLYENEMLAAGTYVFAVKDGCGKTFTKEVVIANEEAKNLTITVGDVVGYSCVEAKDGSVSFSVDNWTDDCTAKLDGVAKSPISVEKGVAQFKFDNLGKASCVFAVANGCDKAVEKTVALNESKLKIDEFKILGSDKTCNDDNHKLFVSVSGGNTEKYNYQFFDSEGKIVDEVVGEKNKYHTPRLQGGTYTVKVSVNDICSVTSDGFDIIPTYTTTLSKLDMPDCNAETQRIVVEIVKESAYEMGDGMVFYYVSPESKYYEITDNARKIDDNKYLLTGVPATAVAIATSDDKCTSVANLSDAEKLLVALPNSSVVTVEDLNVRNCFGESSVALKYNGFDEYYDLVCTLESENSSVSIPSQISQDKSGSFEFSELPVGKYKIYLNVGMEGCTITTTPVYEKSFEIKEIAKPFKIVSVTPKKNNCEEKNFNGSVEIVVEGVYASKYKWSISTDPLVPEWNDGENKNVNENGEVTIKKDGLNDDNYIFTLTDVCGEVKQEKFEVGKDYIPQAMIIKVDEKPYSCPELKNAGIKFHIEDWDQRDTVTFDGEPYPKFVETAKEVVFDYSGYGSGIHKFRISDVCNRSIEETVDFDKISKDKGFRIETADFDASKAACNIESRKLIATLAGGNAEKYTYKLTSDDGSVIDEIDNADDKTYTSSYLPDGHKFTLEVKSDEGCVAKYTTTAAINSSENIKAYRKSVNCGAIQTLFIVESENVIEDAKVYAISRSDKSYLLGSMQKSKSYSRTLSSKELSLGTSDIDLIFDYVNVVRESDGCEILIPLEDYEEENNNPFDEVVIPISNTQQKCVDVNDGSILVDLKNVNTKYNTLMTVENVETKDKFIGEQYENSTYMVKGLAPGEYKVFLDLTIGDCPLGVSHEFENQTIKKLGVLEVENLPLHHTRCVNGFVDTAIVKLTGWVDGVYNWTYRLKNSNLYEGDVEYYEAAIAPDDHIAIFVKHPGKAYLQFYDQCKNKVVETTFDIPEPNVDFRIENDVFDPSKADCNVSYHSLQLDFSGNFNDIASYSLTSGDEVIDNGTKIADNKYVSPILPYGKLFHFEAKSSEGCKVSYDTKEVLTPYLDYMGSKKEVKCGDEKSTLIIAKHEDPEWNGLVYALEPDGSWTEFDKPMQNGYFKTTVKRKDDYSYKYIKVKHEECEALVELEAYEEDGNPLINIEPEIVPIPQTCYGVNNGHITAKYESFDTEYDVIFSATSVDDENYVVYGEATTENECVIDMLPTGKYNVKMHLSVGGCPVDGLEKELGEYEITNLVEQPFAIKNYVLTQSYCYEDENFKPNALITFENYYSGVYYWKYKVGDKESAVFDHVLDDALYFDIPNEGHLVFTVWDACAETHPESQHIWTIEDEVIRQQKPTISVIEDRAGGVCPGDGTSLLVEFDNAVDGKGMIYAECNTSDNANFMEKLPDLPKLPKSGKFRIYDFQYGSYGDKFSYTYDLDEDVERKLIPAIYRIGYKNTDEKCPNEIVWVSDTVLHPIKLKMAVRNVLCESTNEASVCFVPERPYSSHVNYTIHSDKDSDRGSNWAELLGKSASEQRAEFEKKFVLGHAVDNQHPFRCNVFEDIKEIRIAPTSDYKMNQEALDASIQNKEDRMKYPLPEFRLNNDIDRVVSDYFGLRLLPAGEYVITTTDMEGCVYKDTFEVKGPKYPLAIYDPQHDSDGYCDSDKRRISFKAIGGWTKDNNESSYDFYLVDSKKKLDDLFDTEDVHGSLILDNDYVGLSRKEALPPVTDKIQTSIGGVVKEVEYENAHSEKFTSPILDPGTYNLVVIDDLGCVATLESKIEIKAKYTLNGTAVLDKCDPIHNNRLYPEVSDGINDVTSKVSSYTLRIGHATECVGYPLGCAALGHVHECYPDDNHPERAEYPNCVAMESSTDKHEVNSKYSEKDGISGNAITEIPKGKIGVFAIMDDGCTAFNEFEYYTKGKQKLTLTNLETFAAKCNGVEDENGGALHFELYGGNDGYAEFTLDDKDITLNGLYGFVSHQETVDEGGESKTVTKTEAVDYNLEILSDLYKSNLSVEEVVRSDEAGLILGILKLSNWFDAINYRFTPLEDLEGVVDEDGNVNYDYLEKEYKDYKNSYSFVLPKLSGTTEYTYDENGNIKKTQGKPHVLTVIDNAGCEASLEFFIDQPAKLEVFPSASMPCPDGVGRIITSNTRGGTAPYRWSVEKFDSEELNKIYNENKSEDQLPKDLDGYLLGDKSAFLDYYQDNTNLEIEERGVAVERIPADVYKEHTVFAYDVNGCVAKGIQETYSGNEGDWNKVKTDYLVGRYHNYGDVLVLTDNSYYEDNMIYEDNNPPAGNVVKGFNTPFVYDSMHVDVIFNTAGMGEQNKKIVENLIVERKPSSLYVYGVKEGNSVKFNDIVYTGPIWGIPSEIASSVIPDDKYDEYSAQLASAEKILDDYAEVVAKTTIFKTFGEWGIDYNKYCEYRNYDDEKKEECQNTLYKLIENELNSVRLALTPDNYIGKVIDKETGEREKYSIRRIEEKVNEIRGQILDKENDFWKLNLLYSTPLAFNESLLRYYRSERDYESIKGKIDGHCKLSNITSAFDLLIEPNEAETEVLNRMAFIKFTKSDKEDKKEKDISVDDLFNSLKEHQIPFGIKVTTYITGCDLTTELNGLYVLNQDTLPYDSPEYKTNIELSVTQNPAVDGSTTVLVTTNKAITNDNPLTYFVYSVDGKNTNLGNNVMFYGENGTCNKVIMDNGDGWITEYNYSIPLSGLDDMNGYVFVAKFGDRTESIKILTK